MTAILFASVLLFLPTTPALPYFLDLRPGEHGTPSIRVYRPVKKKTVAFNIERDMNGESVYREVIVEIELLKASMVELRDLQELKAFTAEGKELTPVAAIARIGPGAVVLASTDGRKLDPAVAKLFKDDAIVLCSPDLIPRWDGETKEVVYACPLIAKAKPD
jgi:hypothetical protein